MPEYKGLKPTAPHLMGQKLECLRKLISKTGPLKARASGVVPLVEKLTSFEDLRKFMAHGIVEVALRPNGDPIYKFQMSGDTLTLTRRDAQSRTDKLANIAKNLAQKLEALSNNQPPRAIKLISRAEVPSFK